MKKVILETQDENLAKIYAKYRNLPIAKDEPTDANEPPKYYVMSDIPTALEVSEKEARDFVGSLVKVFLDTFEFTDGREIIHHSAKELFVTKDEAKGDPNTLTIKCDFNSSFGFTIATTYVAPIHIAETVEQIARSIATVIYRGTATRKPSFVRKLESQREGLEED